MYLSVGAFACVGKCRSFGAQYAFVCVYPGFHFGLCPHYTLGFAGVSCLKALVINPNFDALALGFAEVPCLKALAISPNSENNAASATQCNGIEF